VLLDDGVAAAVPGVVQRSGGPVWNQSAFEKLAAEVRSALAEETRTVLADATRVLASWREAERALSGSADLPMLPALADMKAQVGRLVYRGFVADVGAGRLPHLPRYLRAVLVRLERLPSAVDRDRLLMDRVAALQEAYLHRVAALPAGRPPSERLRAVRWMLEELRVSLWAQQLGTAYPVSETRIRRALDG
jgi:ATP-dependent helicase HrpA